MRPFKHVTIRFGRPMEMPPPVNPDDPLEGHDHTECRAFTDSLMREIARLSGVRTSMRMCRPAETACLH